MHIADAVASIWVVGALLVLGVGLRRAWAVKIATGAVSLILIALAGLWFLGCRPPMARHDREARQLQGDLAKLVDDQVPDASVAKATRAVENRAPAGGYCSYFVTLTVSTSQEVAKVDTLLRQAAATHGPDWMLVSVKQREPGTLLVDAERLGEGGTVDPRCG